MGFYVTFLADVLCDQLWQYIRFFFKKTLIAGSRVVEEMSIDSKFLSRQIRWSLCIFTPG